jgi:PEP-CTERM motif
MKQTHSFRHSSLLIVIGFMTAPASAQVLSFQSTTAAPPYFQETSVSPSSGVWTIPNVAPGVDATLTLLGFYGTGGSLTTVTGPASAVTTMNVSAVTGVPVGYSNALQIGFRGTATTFAGVNFRLSFSAPITSHLAILDMDSEAGLGLQEVVGIQSSKLVGYSLGSEITDMGVTGGFQRFGGSTDGTNYGGVSLTDSAKQSAITTQFDVAGVSAIDFQWEYSRSASGNNSRAFFLASSQAAPEPTTLALLTLGGLSFGGLCLRRRR